MQLSEVITQLEALANPNAAADLARFGVTTSNAYGIAVPKLRRLAKTIGTDHRLAQELWATGSLDARIIASLIDDPKQVTERQMERWVKDFDNWAVCDGCCGNLFDKTPWAYEKAVEWTKREAEFVRRAGFVMMASLAVHDKAARDEIFSAFLPIIQAGATDERNFVKKSVNWALRQIGKRNAKLNQAAIKTAREIQKMNSKAARWVAADALRELTGEAVQKRLLPKTR